MPNWTEITSDDQIIDIFEDDGSRSTQIAIADPGGGAATVYSSDNSTVAEGAWKSKFTKAAGGGDVKVYADLDASDNSIKGIKYQVAG